MRRHEFATLRWAGGAERREGRTRARDFFHKSQAFQSPSRWRSNLLSRLRCCGQVAGVAEIAFEITEKWKFGCQDSNPRHGTYVNQALRTTTPRAGSLTPKPDQGFYPQIIPISTAKSVIRSDHIIATAGAACTPGFLPAL